MRQLRHRLRSLYRVVSSRGPVEAVHVSVLNPLYGCWVERVADDVVRRDGLVFHLDEETISVFTKGAIARGRHERQERTLVERYLPRETDVVELGGGVGYLTAFVDRRVDGRTIVVEANPALVPVLERNRESNDLDYEIVNAAYAPATEAVDFPLAGNYKFSSRLKDSARTTAVPATSLGELVRRYELEDCALIVDVEGDEIELVRRELDVLEAVCDWLLIEFHGKMTGYDAVESTRRRLESAGFRSVDRRPGVELFAAETTAAGPDGTTPEVAARGRCDAGEDPTAGAPTDAPLEASDAGEPTTDARRGARFDASDEG